MSQLPLGLRLATHARLETFVGTGNEAVLAHLSALGERGSVWVWGPPGVGKSHLLQAVTARAHAAGRRSMYVPLGVAARGEFGPELLAGLEALDVLALDDLDAVAGVPGWELALFRLFESLRGRLLLLMAARGAPRTCGFSLPDLTSRAGAAVVYRLVPLGDEGRMVALRRHALARGLELDDAAARYLLSRTERDMTAVCECLDRLDRESLAAQRKLTVPFIRETLARSGR